MILNRWFTLFFFAVGCAQKISVTNRLAITCWNTADYWNFGVKHHTTRELCLSEPFLGTVMNCVYTRLEFQSSMEDAFKYIIDNCRVNGGVSNLTYENLDKLYIYATKNLIKAQEAEKIVSKGEFVQFPVDTQTHVFDLNLQATASMKYQMDMASVYGLILLTYWFGMMVIGSIFRVSYERSNEYNSATEWIRKVLVLPPTAGKYHNQPRVFLGIFSYSVPTRIQSIVILGYIVVTTVIMCINYPSILFDPIRLSPIEQKLKYIGTRAGIISVTQLPMVILFGGRNNILMNITGWSQETFNVYHRWSSRVMVCLSLVHGICHTVFAHIGHITSFKWRTVINWQFGNIATITSLFIVILSVKYIRARWYEFFTLFHKILYMIFIISLVFHCYDFGWIEWIYFALIVHAIDRVGRCLKTFICTGYKPTDNAVFTVYDDDIYKIKIAPLDYMTVFSGQYCYLRVKKKGISLQNHPFSVYVIPGTDRRLNAIVKPKEGATSSIYKTLVENKSQPITFTVSVEGPYGVTRSVNDYNTVLMFAGGVGITALYPYALDAKNYEHTTTRRYTNVYLIWVITSLTPLEWFEDELKSLLEFKPIELQIYVTRQYASRQPSIMSDELETPMATPGHALFGNCEMNGSEVSLNTDAYRLRIQTHIQHKRPDIDAELKELVDRNKSNGKMAVMACGPPGFVDSLRNGVTEITGVRVDYYEEAYSW